MKKVSAAKQPSEKRIPSEGASVRPQVLSQRAACHLDRGSEDEPRDLKRKRSFKNEAPQPTSQKAHGCDAETSSFTRLTEEQCKKLLKLHKLKICVLSDLPIPKHTMVNSAKTLPQLVSQPLESFRDLGAWFSASRRLTENIASQGYVTPTEVQLGSMPLLLGSDEDRGLDIFKSHSTTSKADVDLLTIAPTGSGKTLAFLVPLIQGLLDDRGVEDASAKNLEEARHVRALILAPTHELVEQTVNEGRKLLTGTGLKVSAMRKGTRVFQVPVSGELPQGSSECYVKSDVLVSTPLVLLHSLLTGDGQGARELPSITGLVLDEADVLLEPLFREQTLAIWAACSNPRLRVSLWSATIGSSIESLSRSVILDRRKRLGLPMENHVILRLIVGLKDSALPSISHRLVYTATEQGKLLAMRQILHPSTAETSSTLPALRPPFLVFTQTIERAKALYHELLYDIPPEAGGSSRVAVLHSQLFDLARSDVMAGFRKGEIWVLITTDLLARGVDFRGVNGVVNFDIPNTSAAYVHRAGRTGRAGREGGVSVTLYTKEDIPYVRNISNVIAASRRQYGKSADDSSLPKWLLDALPTVSKKTKQDLKRKGVAARRPGLGQNDQKSRAMRISTKSGYDRRVGNRRKGAIENALSRGATHGVEVPDNDDWGGFND